MDTVHDGNHCDTTEDDYGVRWGRSKETSERFKYYDSFHLDGEEFSVKDTVYLQASDGPPYVAKIAKLRENIGTRTKTMLVHWFFRPCELPERLQTVDYSENSKEIFMAVGSEYTKKFQNPACTITKCRIVCIANETWNRMPSAEQVAAADHVFYRAFDPVKLRLERLDPSKGNCGEHLGIIFSGKGLKVGSSTYSGQVEEGNIKVSRAVGPMNREPGLHSKISIMGKPSKHRSGCQTDHTGKLKISQKSPSAMPMTPAKALPRLESGKGPRWDTSEEQISTKSKLINDKEKSLKRYGKQDFKNLEKRRKIEDSVTGEGKVKPQVSAMKRQMEKGKLSSQFGNVSALPLDRLSKAPSNDAKRSYEKKHEGSMPLSSSKSAGKEINLTRDMEAREAAVLGKGLREESLPSGTVRRTLAGHSRPESRVDERNQESPRVRPYVSVNLKACSPSLKPKRSDGTLRDGLKEECNGANLHNSTSVNTLREAKLVKKEGKDVQEQQNHQHLSSTSITSKSQNTLKARGPGESKVVERIARPLVKGEKIRVTAEDKGSGKLKPDSYPQVLLDRRERISGRDVKGADFHSITEGSGSAIGHGRAFSTEDHYKLYMPNKKIFKFPWDEKKSVEEAIAKGRALLLKNLDPCLNSLEIEAVLENVLDTTCDVRILPPKTITCYKSAEAIAIFKKAEIAEDVLRTLMENLLVISEDERPVLASLPAKPKQIINNFHGFFNLEKFGWKMNDSFDQKNAVATSHCAQTNTVEYDMGLHWRVIQDRDTLEWQKLEEDHQRELQEVKAKYQKS